jgi:hypothetical protein
MRSGDRAVILGLSGPNKTRHRHGRGVPAARFEETSETCGELKILRSHRFPRS